MESTNNLPAAGVTIKSELWKLVRLGLPLGIANLATFLIVATDTIMLGWLGPRELAAASLGFLIYSLALQFAIGCTFSVGPMLARALGQGRSARVPEIVRESAAFLLAIYVLSFPLFIFSEAILVGLGQDEEAATLAAEYLRLMYVAFFPALALVLLSEVCAAHDLAKEIMISTAIGVLLNVALNYVLIYDHGVGLGMRGAAIGSIIVTIAMAAIILVRCRHLFRPIVRKAKDARLRASRLLRMELLRTGFPLGLLEVLLFVFFAQTTVLVGNIGIDALNAHIVVFQATEIAMVVFFGFGEAMAIRIGFLRGERNLTGQVMGLRAGLLLAAAFGAGAGGLLVALQGPLVALYTGNAAEFAETFVLAAAIIPLGAVLLCFNAPQFMLVSALRGYGDTLFSLIASTVCFLLIGLGGGYYLGFVAGLGIAGIWWALAAAIAVLFFALLYRLSRIAPSFARSSRGS